MKIVVYEHDSGGGYAGQQIPMDVLAEGFAMLRCIVADFRAAGHQVTALLDSRLHKLEPPLEANYTAQVLYIEETKKILTNLAANNDALYVIAPETDQILQSYVQLVEKTGSISLNSQSDTIKKVADKTLLYENLQKNSCPTPKTLTLNTTDNLQLIKRTTSQLNYPLIFKPADSTGCSGISLVENSPNIEKALTQIKATSTNPRFIVQEHIKGTPTSVSLFTNNKKTMAVTLNKQQINLAETGAVSNYAGGCVPFEHQKKTEALAAAKRAVASFEGLRGYVGVDLVMGPDQAYILDVNARLTTSYIGVRQVVGFNVAQTLIDTATTGKLPQTVQPLGVAHFSKMSLDQPTLCAYRRAARLAGVITPPFPLADITQAATLVMGYGNTSEEAQIRLEETKNALYDITR